MRGAFYQVKLSAKPTGGGAAELVLPKILKDLDCQFVIVKEGGEEGIIRLEEPANTLKKVEKNKDCIKLTQAQMAELRKSYQKPKLKERYRMLTGEDITGDQFEVDSQGNKVADAIQTVRQGYYLIDVPVVSSKK